jgi:hypothetical protein
MPDEATRTINQLFDFFSSTADKVDHVIGASKPAPRQRQSRTTPAPSHSNSPSRFRIIEATCAESGTPIFIVTDGRNKAECNSIEFARHLVGVL